MWSIFQSSLYTIQFSEPIKNNKMIETDNGSNSEIHNLHLKTMK